MTLTIPGVDVVVEREQWQNPTLPINGGGYLAPLYKPVIVDHGRAHYTAATNLPDGDTGETAEDVLNHLTQSQSFYRRVRGYSIGYQFAVDWLGRAIEIRGFEYRPAANNGDKPVPYRGSTYAKVNLNAFTFVVLFLVDGQDGLNQAMLDTGNALFREARRRTEAAGGRWKWPYVRPHHESDYTQCCGLGITADIVDDRLHGRDLPPPTPKKDEVDPMQFMWRHPDYHNVFLLGAGPAQNLTPAGFKLGQAKGLPYIEHERHPQMLATCLHQAGLDESDLVKA